jgi:hypothetical protein
MEDNIIELRKDFGLNNETKMVVVLSILTHDMNRYVAMYPKVWFWGRCGSRVDTHGQSIRAYYECCYAKLQMVLGSEVCPRYLRGLA